MIVYVNNTTVLVTPEIKLYGCVCETIKHDYEYWRNLEGKITSHAYLGSTLHFKTPMYNKGKKANKALEQFSKQIRKNNYIIKLCWQPNCGGECDMLFEIVKNMQGDIQIKNQQWVITPWNDIYTEFDLEAVQLHDQSR